MSLGLEPNYTEMTHLSATINATSKLDTVAAAINTCMVQRLNKILYSIVKNYDIVV